MTRKLSTLATLFAAGAFLTVASTPAMAAPRTMEDKKDGEKSCKGDKKAGEKSCKGDKKAGDKSCKGHKDKSCGDGSCSGKK